jgi:hypothetical protein
MNLTNNISELPYIVHPINKQKILIDTASTKSFVNPSIVNRGISDLIKKDPFKISTVHGSTVGNFSLTTSFPEIFKSDTKLKFYLFKFHKHFDWLLGMDSLKNLNGVINLKQNLLILPNVTFKIYYQKTTSQYCNINSSNIDFSKFRTEHLSHEERNALLQLIQNFSDIFKHDSENLSFTNRIKHSIRTRDA